MVYGYARVSAKDQKLDRQIVELKSFGVKENNIYCDKQSGKNFERENYQALKSQLKQGDLLVIKSIDRLGRNYDMILDEWAQITKIIEADIYVIDFIGQEASSFIEWADNYNIEVIELHEYSDTIKKKFGDKFKRNFPLQNLDIQVRK